MQEKLFRLVLGVIFSICLLFHCQKVHEPGSGTFRSPYQIPFRCGKTLRQDCEIYYFIVALFILLRRLVFYSDFADMAPGWEPRGSRPES